MKTDLATTGTFKGYEAQKLTADQLKAKDALKAAKPIDALKKPVGPDYKLDLSSTTPSPGTPVAPALPSIPSAPSVKVPEIKPETKLADAAKDKAVDEVKEESVKKASEVTKVEAKEGSIKKPAVIFIKGWDVLSSPSKSESGYAGVGRLAESITGSRIYGWDQKDEIIAQIKKVEKSQPVILVGHSFGGDTAVEVANELDSLEHKFRPVDLLITIDSVGFNNDIIPQNVKKHLNVFGENDLFLNDGPHVARRHDMTSVKNILSPLDHTELDDNKEIQFEIVNMIQDTLSKIS